MNKFEVTYELTNSQTRFKIIEADYFNVYEGTLYFNKKVDGLTHVVAAFAIGTWIGVTKL